eukprot:SAG11_NODE_888_length_6693_cov_2.506218_2_plen_802_part_00
MVVSLTECVLRLSSASRVWIAGDRPKSRQRIDWFSAAFRVAIELDLDTESELSDGALEDDYVKGAEVLLDLRDHIGDDMLLDTVLPFSMLPDLECDVDSSGEIVAYAFSIPSDFTWPSAAAIQSCGGSIGKENTEPKFFMIDQCPWEHSIVWDDSSDENASFCADEDDDTDAPHSTGGGLPPSSSGVGLCIEKSAPAGSPGKIGSGSMSTRSEAYGVAYWGTLRSAEADIDGLTADIEDSLLDDSEEEEEVVPPPVQEQRGRSSSRPWIPYRNSEFMMGRWIASVIWDDASAPSVAPSRLILGEELRSASASIVSPAARETIRSEAFQNFELSDEAYYNVEARTSKGAGKLLQITHSVPALSLKFSGQEPRGPELEFLHRPRRKLPPKKMRFAPATTRQSSGNDELLTRGGNINMYRTEADISATVNDRVILCEYLEKHPIVLSNIGMASRIVTYVRPEDSASPLATSHIPDGRIQVLGSQDTSPFRPVELPPDRHVTSMTNNLFIAPMGHQEPNHTDFLLIRTLKDGTDNKWQFVIRDVQALYVVGSLIPKQDVPEPKESEEKDIVRRRIRAFLLRQLRDHTHIHYGEIKEAFSTQNDVLLRRTIKETADEDSNDQYSLKDGGMSEAELRTYLSPETIALHDSMLAAWYRLRERYRIRNFLTAGRPEQALEHLHGQQMQSIVQKVLAELKDTPWHRSKAILGAITSASRISRADLRDRSWLREKHNMPEILEKNLELKQKYGAGTDTEIGNLNNADCRRILILCGVPEAVAKRQTLAKRHELLRRFQKQWNQSQSGDEQR